MTAFRVIPVIDLRRGLVVRARAGDREAYAPIRTPLASDSTPAAVARGLIAAISAEILYVADLDAIMEGCAPDLASLRAIQDACPGVALWVDAGFSEADGVERFLAKQAGRPVLGSESLTDPALPRRLGARAVLSLDSRGDERLGPRILHEDPSLWPDEMIVMTLTRVGGGAGPDRDAIARVIAAGALFDEVDAGSSSKSAAKQKPGVRVFAAGGVRGPADVAALKAIGAAGALVASAIHDGGLRKADVAPKKKGTA